MKNPENEKVKNQIDLTKKMVKAVLSSFEESDLEVKPYYMVSTYKDYVVQVSFGTEEPVIIVRIAKLIPKNISIDTVALNRLNNETYLGSHTITKEADCHQFYIYKISCWNLGDGKPEEKRFSEIFSEGCAEADKGYKTLTQQF